MSLRFVEAFVKVIQCLLFLFILAMEGLHVVICMAIQIGIFRGAPIGYNVLLTPHLFMLMMSFYG